MTTLILEFKKIQSNDKTLYRTFYSNSKADTIVNEGDINDVFESIYSTIILNIQKCLRQDFGWITDSVMDHNINISKNTPLASEIYIKLPKELDHPRNGLINIENIDDDQCFK